MDISTQNLLAGWIGMLGGVVSGALIGLFFHREEWMEGYGSFRRRLTRLGHISFFGLGFLNMMFAVTTMVIVLPPLALRLASGGFILGAVAMPICCFLTAWRKPFRHLFPIPVAALSTAIIALLAGWGAP